LVTKPKSPEFLIHWLRAIGFFRGFLLVSFVPVSAGAVTAYWETGRWSFPLFFAGLALVWAIHVGGNLLNEYYDHVSGCDDINQIRTPFSGGTRVIQDGLIRPIAIFSVGTIALVVGLGGFFVLSFEIGWPVFALAILGSACAAGYSAKPIWLAYRGLGELTIGLVFGPFLVLTGYYLQARTFSLSAIMTGIVLGLLSSAIITINQIPDLPADEKAGKRNLVVRFGLRFGLRLWAVLLWGSLALVVAAWFGRLFPVEALGVLIMIAPIFLLTRKAEKKTKELPGLISRCRFTILSQLGVWLLLTGGFLAAAWSGS
jgi:1,4-dihydroxy-2-naphthoate polyprenyltransferase